MTALNKHQPALELRQLSGGWGDTTVIENVSLVLDAGETISIVGRNGVGKSTLLELIVGRAQRHSGAIVLAEVDCSRQPTYKRSDEGIGYVPQEREVFPSLTVRENLSVGKRPGAWTEERVFATFPGLSRRASSMGWQLSGGEQQMLSIGRGLASSPRVLMLDEPSMGLAPTIADQIFERIEKIHRESKIAILLVEQRVAEALESCDRGYVLESGRVVLEGVHDTLVRDERVKRAYLGM